MNAKEEMPHMKIRGAIKNQALPSKLDAVFSLVTCTVCEHRCWSQMRESRTWPLKGLGPL